jgi:hypothetical protein
MSAACDTVLGAINHGDQLIQGTVTAREFLKMALTYCVPFTVSTSGALGAARIKRTAAGEPADVRMGSANAGDLASGRPQ